MGKTISRPKAGEPDSHAPTSESDVVEIPRQPLTEEAKAKLAILVRMFEERQEEYDRLSDVEKQKVDEDWEKFAATMNEAHFGNRIPYPNSTGHAR